jgi:ribosomal-protein-serine acetyltransferase
MDMPETIDAGSITLRRWTLDRANELDQAINESLAELMPFMPWATADHDLEATKGYLERSGREWDRGENFDYAILTPGAAVVGSCGLMSRQGPGVFEIGYWVHSAHTGKRYATAAASAVAAAGLARTSIERVEIHHDAENPASGRVAAKAGFHRLGRVEAEKKAPADSGTHLVWGRNRGEDLGSPVQQ